MCKVTGSNSRKRRAHLDFCANMSVKFDFILVPRSQFFDFLRETSYKHALEHLEAAGPEKNRSFFFFFLPTVNAYYYY